MGGEVTDGDTKWAGTTSGEKLNRKFRLLLKVHGRLGGLFGFVYSLTRHEGKVAAQNPSDLGSDGHLGWMLCCRFVL